MKKIVFGIGIVLAVLAVLTAPAAADYNIFHLVPEDSSCSPGENVTVWVKVNTSYNDINAAQAGIIFDPSVVNVTLVEKGTPDWYLWDWQVYDYGADKKYVFIGASDLLNTYGPGELELGKMTLHCEAPGISSLHFTNESEVGNRRTEISHPGGVICGQAGNECTMEDGTFTCMAPQETFSKDLVEGWNLISLPLYNATDMTVANIMSSVSGSYDALYRYDASAHGWVPLSSSDTMANGVGYFIHMTAADTWTYTGSAYTNMDGISLQQGLNMVGWLNCSKPIDDALSSIEGDYWYVARWNASSQSYETYNPVAPSVFNDFTTLERGEGYFISMKGAGTLTASCSA